jgi:L-iditol 2-dehydrogenase
VVIECAGTKATWETSIDITRRGGRVLWFGGLPGGTKVEIDAARVHYGEIDLFNMHGGTMEDAREAFELIVSGAVKVAPLLNGELPLEQVELALKKMIAGEVVKLVIVPGLQERGVTLLTFQCYDDKLTNVKLIHFCEYAATGVDPCQKP